MAFETSMNNTLAALLVERDILDLLARFDDAAISSDLAAFRELWTDDATWEIGKPIPMTAEGPDAIVEALQTLMQQNQFFFRMTARPVFAFHAEHTSLRSTTIELAARAGRKAYANVAFYVDEVVNFAGSWRFPQAQLPVPVGRYKP